MHHTIYIFAFNLYYILLGIVADKSASGAGQDHLPSHKPWEAGHHEEGCGSCERKPGACDRWGCPGGAPQGQSHVPRWARRLWGKLKLKWSNSAWSVGHPSAIQHASWQYIICNLILIIQQDEPYMKPGLADMKNAVVVPHIASASKVCRNGGSQSSCCDESYYIWEDKDTTTDTTIAIILLVSSVDTWRNGNAGCSQRSCKSSAAAAGSSNL